MEKYLGIDIGGTNVKLGLVDEQGQILEKIKYPTATLKEGSGFLVNFIDVLGAFLTKYPEVKKVGLGVPGTLTKDRNRLLELPNISELNGVLFIPELQAKFPGVDFHIENDANAAALGELYFGEGDVPDSYIFITLGTGVGGGAIIDRKIFTGGDGNGLEIGHIISGNGKTIEENIGKKGLVSLAEHYLSRVHGSVLHDKIPMKYKDIEKAAHKKDPIARMIFSDAGVVLGEALVSSIRILDVKTVIIGGGVADTFEYVEKAMHTVLDKHLTKYYSEPLEIKMATLGNNAGIIGAAALCFVD